MRFMIDREQRDAFYGEVMRQLTAVGDIYIAVENDDYPQARRLRGRFEAGMRLLDDIGWEPEMAGESFELTAPPGQLVAALRHLNESAAVDSRLYATRPKDEEGLAERAAIVCDTCGRLLSQIAEQHTTGAPQRAPRP